MHGRVKRCVGKVHLHFDLLLTLVTLLALAVSASAASAPISDNFNNTVLDTSLWTVVNPVADGSVFLNGSQAGLTLPAGSEHDIWTTGNRSLRLMQAVADVDFEVEVKFDAVVNQGFQMQGLIVEQDSGNYLRFDQYSDGNRVHLFAASFSGGTPTKRLDTTLAGVVSPFWLRVQRIGSNWTYTWSQDGTNFSTAIAFNYSMVVNRMGPFVGNCCSTTSPAFTALVDYFQNIGPGISGVTASPSVNSSTINWTTDVLANSTVRYGLTTGYGSSVGSGTLVTSHSIDLLGLACNTLYHYRVSSTNSAGATSSGIDQTFTTASCPVGSPPPVISNIVVNQTQTSASVAWNTDKLADSRVDFGLTTAYGAFISDPQFVANHALTLSPLTCSTTYHFRVTSSDQSGNLGSSSDRTFTTSSCGTTGAPVSDDFHTSGLDTSLWTVFNPRGDGTVSVSGNRLLLSIPGGVDHDVWSAGNFSLRALQSIGNTNFQVVLKFDSPPERATQTEGVLVEQDGANFIRFDIHRACTYTHIYAATFTAGQPQQRYDISLDSSARKATATNNRAGTMSPIWLRLQRSGSKWILGWSIDGTTFTNAPSFSFALTVNRIGPFASNCCGTTSPSFISSVDYFFNTASPIIPEDAGAADIPRMTPFRPRAPITNSAPVIDVWYGPNQTFGQNGIPQQWVNILGTAYGNNAITTLSYTLNGGAPQALALGKKYPRIVENGDFNVEIDYANLHPGANSVVITAIDKLGNQSTQTVTVNYVAGRTWPLPYSVDWSTVGNISNVAQIVDGKWQLQPNGSVRTMEVGYDRLIAIGDRTWTNYEVTAELTVNTFDCHDFGIGIVTGWQGHSTIQYGKVLPDQPRTGHVFTGLGWWTNEIPGVPQGSSAAIEIYNNTVANPETILAAQTRFLALGVKYIFKFRVEPDTGGGSKYSFKVWPASSPEPQIWDLQANGALNRGSILLATHKGDVSFGRVTIVSVP